MDRQNVGNWITDNLLDTEAWERASEQRQAVAVKQAERVLARWYPDAELTAELVAYQAVWELQGLDPALKYQKHNVKQVTDSSESVSYKDGERPVVSPEVQAVLGPIDSGEDEEETLPQYGGALI